MYELSKKELLKRLEWHEHRVWCIRARIEAIDTGVHEYIAKRMKR